MSAARALVIVAAAALAACGSESSTAAPTADRTPSSATVRAAGSSTSVLRGKPVLLFRVQRKPSTPGWVYTLYVRTRKALPRDHSGVRAYLEVEGARGETAVYTTSRQSNCYSQDIFVATHGSPTALRNPHDGQGFNVSISEYGGVGKPFATARVTAKFVETTNATKTPTPAQRAAVSQLGCHNSRF